MAKVVKIEHVPDPKPAPIEYVRLPGMDEIAELLDGHPAPLKLLMIAMRPDGSIATWSAGLSPLETLGIMDIAKMITMTNDEEEYEE